MNIFALPSLFSGVAVLLLGSFIFFRETRSPLNRIFILLCVSLALWSLAEFGYRQADSYNTAYFWLKLSDLSFIVAPLLLHFVLFFTQESKLFQNRLTYTVMYAPALMIILLTLTSNAVGGEPVRQYWGWTYSIPEDSLVYSISYAWAYGLGILSVYLCLLYYLKQSDVKKKQQAKYVFIGLTIPLASGLVTEWLLPMLQITVPESTATAFAVTVACAGYAIWRYELFAITAATAAEGIISTMPDSLLLVGPDQRITMANPAALETLGYGEDELVGQHVEAIFTAQELDTSMFTGRNTDYPAGRGVVSAETSLRTKTGSSIPISLATSVMRDKEGVFQGTICIGRDITELKLAEEEKHRMEEQLRTTGRLAAVGELSAGVAHELNNPLAAIQAFAQFLVSRKDLDETTKRDVETIYREAQRATRITENLLSFAGVNSLQKRLVSLNEIVERSLKLHTHLMKASGIEVEMELELAPDLPMTMADPEQMQQVFANLIRNAEQAMTGVRGGGKLRVKTNRVGESLQVAFSDDGPGISDENAKSLFDPFFTTRDVGEGTGLGLSICYGIVEGHGGHIYTSSKHGQGATFIIEIPIISDTPGLDVGTGRTQAAAKSPV
ncbi:ATP-binding protein [Chloroflexota bacterium]